MPGVGSSRRPIHSPASVARHHQIAATYTSVLVSAREAPATETTARAVAEPPKRITDTRRKSRNLTWTRGSRFGEDGQHPREPLHSVHDQVGLLDDRARALVGAHADADGGVERASRPPAPRAR